MKTERIYCGILLEIILILSACSQKQPLQNNPTSTRIDVVTTFYPLYDVTKKISGDKADVQSLIPAGVEPHDYEPTPSDIAKLGKSKAFVVMGLEFSEIEGELAESANNIQVIDAPKGVPLIDAEEDNTGKDPHVWLSPNNMIIIAANIRDGLKNVDQTNSKLYDENAKKVINELKKLDSEYKTGLSKCKKNVILTNHRAFAYLAKDYGFKQIGISGIEPETEPTPKEIIKIKDEAIKNNVKYIFTEELVDTRVAETIAKEIGAKTFVLDPIEGVKDPNEDYFSLMRENLAKLKIALECS